MVLKSLLNIARGFGEEHTDYKRHGYLNPNKDNKEKRDSNPNKKPSENKHHDNKNNKYSKPPICGKCNKVGHTSDQHKDYKHPYGTCFGCGKSVHLWGACTTNPPKNKKDTTKDVLEEAAKNGASEDKVKSDKDDDKSSEKTEKSKTSTRSKTPNPSTPDKKDKGGSGTPG